MQADYNEVLLKKKLIGKEVAQAIKNNEIAENITALKQTGEANRELEHKLVHELDSVEQQLNILFIQLPNVS